MITIKDKLPFWLKGSQALKLAAACQTFWERWETWLNEAEEQASITDCSIGALEQHADDRSIDRLPGESETVWRNRVKNAFIAARDAGSLSGFETILTAHGVTNYTVEERVAGLDWDIILVNLDPDGLSIDSTILNQIFSRWGRPTRRFSAGHEVISPVYFGPGAANFIEHHGVAT